MRGCLDVEVQLTKRRDEGAVCCVTRGEGCDLAETLLHRHTSSAVSNRSPLIPCHPRLSQSGARLVVPCCADLEKIDSVIEFRTTNT